MTTTYSESAKGVYVTQERAEQEMRDHGIPADAWTEGLAYAKRGQSYSAKRLLDWLGY